MPPEEQSSITPNNKIKSSACVLLPSLQTKNHREMLIVLAPLVKLKASRRVDETWIAPAATAGFLLGLIAFILFLLFLFLLFTSTSIFSFITGLLILCSPILAIIGSISGIIGLIEIKKHPDQYEGKGYAIAGIILSLLALACFAWLLILL
jgi:hypothetical protein